MSLSISSPRKRSAPRPFPSAKGYDLVAEHYDRWAWQEFWRRNEYPVVLTSLLEAAPTRAILDLGIGTGAFLSYASARLSPALRLVGLDISRGMLAKAHSRLGGRAELLQGDLQQALPFSDKSFDAVIMMRVANHLTDLGAVVSEIGRVLSSPGIFLATDLADEYNYTCTRIPTPECKVSIETHKHPRDEWIRALARHFQTADVEEFTPSKLSKSALAPKAFVESAPIFKLITALKTR